MDVSPAQLEKLARKLVEVFARVGPEDHAFGRYWRIVGLVGSFSESAEGPFEQALAKMMQDALEARLRAVASYSVQEEAAAVADMLNSPPRDRRKQRWKLSHLEKLQRLR
ncbi:hypothetical protein [Hyphomicrobium sp. DY-1]|uniref:hypothetical protein n=1 Tax=Hyphomicrobium sp. DY-1 TaxID=3075650 RepID=UPI0039C0CF5D